tara:strand:+ start:10397 stop:10861 length:465 start_codon:yes stop_codon:yes gene_type:complete
VTTRYAKLSDLPDILKIEQSVFKDEAWSENMLAKELELFSCSRNMVILHCNEIVGYLISHVFLDEVHILNLAIDIKFQSLGLSKMLLKKFLKNFTNPVKIILEVKENNYIAINLYKKLEFDSINTRKNYYKDGKNAITMEKKINYKNVLVSTKR